MAADDDNDRSDGIQPATILAVMSMLDGLSVDAADAECAASPFEPPGFGGTPPGHGGTPPGHTNPPGHGGTPPGQQGRPPRPPGQDGEPPPGHQDDGSSDRGGDAAGSGEAEGTTVQSDRSVRRGVKRVDRN